MWRTLRGASLEVSSSAPFAHQTHTPPKMIEHSKIWVAWLSPGNGRSVVVRSSEPSAVPMPVKKKARTGGEAHKEKRKKKKKKKKTLKI